MQQWYGSKHVSKRRALRQGGWLPPRKDHAQRGLQQAQHRATAIRHPDEGVTAHKAVDKPKRAIGHVHDAQRQHEAGAVAVA